MQVKMSVHDKILFFISNYIYFIYKRGELKLN